MQPLAHTNANQLALLLIAGLLPACGGDPSAAPSPPPPQPTQSWMLSKDLQLELQQQGEQILQDVQGVGMSMAVIHNGEVVWGSAWGWADIDTGLATTVDTVFTVGSTSKSFVGVAISQAVDRGLLSLDTPLKDLGLPFAVANPHFPDQPITLRHLVSHTSGLRDGEAYNCAYYEDEDARPLILRIEPDSNCPDPAYREQDDFLRAHLLPGGRLYAATHWANHAPGRAFHYSNVGAALATAAFEAGTGTSLETWSQTHIFEPLSMQHSRWHATAAGPSPSRRYRPTDDGWLAWPEYSLSTWADGGLMSSARDLAHYLAAVRNARDGHSELPLSADATERMLSPTTDRNTPFTFQGIFWVGNGQWYGHDGSDPGTTSLMFLDPVKDVGVVLLMNTELDDLPGGSGAAVLDFYQGVFDKVGAPSSK